MGKYDFEALVKAAYRKIERLGLSEIYVKRLDFEIEQIRMQGAQRYFEDLFDANLKFDKNPNQLLLPWLLGRFTGDANIDPIANREGPLVLSSRYDDIQAIIKKTGKLPIDIRQDDDKPDIDIDCLPEARNQIKDYVAKRYGKHNVASVGTWQAYLLKQAIADAYSGLGLDKLNQKEGAKNRAIELTKILPDDANEIREGGYGACKGRVKESGIDKECGFNHKELECPQCHSGDTDTPTIAMIMRDYPEIGKFIAEDKEKHQQVIDTAIRLVGRIKHAGKHAGGLIIADRDLFGNVPMQFDKKTGQWVSVWTEGRNTQLSKFGYVKWDVLGLKNLSYIKTSCEMIRENHGISFGDQLEGWDDSDPTRNIAGHYWENGERKVIPLEDPAALKLANDSQTDSIFQFDTELAKCCSYDSKVNIIGGTKSIESLDPKLDKILYHNKNEQLCYTDNYAVVDAGFKQLFEIELSDGRIMRLAADHKIATSNGYRTVAELVVGEEVIDVENLTRIHKQSTVDTW